MKQVTNLLYFLITLYLALISFSANADNSDKASKHSSPTKEGLNFLFGFNVSVGVDSDKLITLQTSNGKASINAGSGFGIHAGVSWRFHQDFDVRATIGSSSINQSYENGSVGFSRYPLSLSSHYFFGRHGLGGGVDYHISPTLDVDIKNVLEGEAKFDNAMGPFVEYIWTKEGPPKAIADIYVGLRYTRMTYRFTSGQSHQDYKGNNVGINFGLSF